jgi:hypothetical protein
MIDDDVMIKFEVPCELKQMWKNAVMTKYEVLCGLEKFATGRFHEKIWSNMWIRTDDRGWYLTKFEVICGKELMIKDFVMTNIKVLFGLESMLQEAFTNNMKYYVD